MSATNPSGTQQEAAAAAASPVDTFTVDFDGVRASFDEDSSKNSGAGGVLNARSLAGAGAAALAPLVLGVAEASAKGGEFGIIEGKTASFFHPIVMVRRRNESFSCRYSGGGVGGKRAGGLQNRNDSLKLSRG